MAKRLRDVKNPISVNVKDHGWAPGPLQAFWFALGASSSSIGQNEAFVAEGIGTFRMECHDGRSWQVRELKDILFVPGLEVQPVLDYEDG